MSILAPRTGNVVTSTLNGAGGPKTGMNRSSVSSLGVPSAFSAYGVRK